MIGNKDVLTAALNIHSVEARHASHLRQMRKARGGAAASLKPWITGANDTGIGAAVDAVYEGEDNKNQAGVEIDQLNGAGGKISVNAATESFDEPLTAEAVLAIVSPFIS
ncbi:ferritin-like domain-containing protein [Albibacterium profundi]|uniref:Ferritin-like domain-containing protein n=1 Tax=Albibacterium profundi TaxID=3134906 RepID=A0ABV5C9L7_9SPHI